MVEVSVDADGVSKLYVTAGALLHPVSLAHLTAHSAFDHDPRGRCDMVLHCLVPPRQRPLETDPLGRWSYGTASLVQPLYTALETDALSRDAVHVDTIE